MKLKISRLNKAFIKFFKEENNCCYTKVADINRGYCATWALIARKLFGVEIWINRGFYHCFIKHNDKFYDAQTSEGVKDWIDLKGLREVRKGLISLRKGGKPDKIEKMTEKKLRQYFRSIETSDINKILKLYKK